MSNMELIPEDIEAYTAAHCSPESELLAQINRETHMQVLKPRMLSGHVQGRMLAAFSQMMKPQRILEIGTYTGYSALCMAEGLTPDGTLITLDINEELHKRVQGYFDASPYAGQIDYRIGHALELIPDIAGPFDLVFIDADKENYQAYYDLVIDKVRKDGFIIADNVLWSGKVLPAYRKKLDKDTDALIRFNQSVQEDDRVENVLAPVRDGLLVIRKR